MPNQIKTQKKLIEVALPLEAVNVASAREKSIRHGHPSTLHLWWARRPLAAARAVIFAQMVDDPSTYVDTLVGEPTTRRAAQRELKKRHELWETRTAALAEAASSDTDVPEPGARPTLEECAADIERMRLFGIIEELVQWDNSTNAEVLGRANAEIWQSWRRTCAANAGHPGAKELFDRNRLPAFHDPFAGGGALPLEAQRLGLMSYATDLNPVAVLINKAMIEVPPTFGGRSPVMPEAKSKKNLIGRQWTASFGIAEDVRSYGRWLRDEAKKVVGKFYPQIEVTAALAKDRPDLKPLVGKKLDVIAYLWTRTVKSPNPAFAQADVPLAATFMLSSKSGKEVYVEPHIDGKTFSFDVKVGKPPNQELTDRGTKFSQGSFRCLFSDVAIRYEYIDDEANAGRLGQRLMAVVAAGVRGRVYLPATKEMETLALSAQPSWKPDIASRGTWASNAQGRVYGFKTFGDYFSARQSLTLSTLSDLIDSARTLVKKHAITAGLPDDGVRLAAGGAGAEAYADAIAVYLAIALDKAADYNSTICRWISGGETLRNTFGRQAIPMTWDYCEANTLGSTTGSFESGVSQVANALETIMPSSPGKAYQCDAQSIEINDRVVSTDPPYYDNIGYADLSDFFYAWLRRSLKPIFPELFSTLAVPKAEELVAESYRHGSKEKAEAFFLEGMTKAMHRLAEQANRSFPVTIYYAFKQAENDDAEGIASTGWDTFLEAVIRAGFGITGTWPIRTERGARSTTNTLASSIILVCRPRASDAPTASRRELITALGAELPKALAYLQAGNIAPVDLAQAAIGPGMSVYTRYARVLDAEGKTVTVRDALALINQTLDEALAEQEGDFDADTRWALAWFEQMGFGEGEFGTADVLARAKVTAVAALAEDGIVVSKAGKVRLNKPSELPANWDPSTDKRLTIWQMVHQLIRVQESGGEAAAGELVAKIGVKAEIARELAYRLYTLCERKKRPQEALAYNALVQSWPEISRLARDKQAHAGAEDTAQSELFGKV